MLIVNAGVPQIIDVKKKFKQDQTRIKNVRKRKKGDTQKSFVNVELIFFNVTNVIFISMLQNEVS